MNFKIVASLFSLLFVANSLLVQSQENVQRTPAKQNSNTSIIEELNSRKPSQGNVYIYQDEAIKGLLAKSVAANLPVYSSGDGSVQYVKMRGYKIQVFSGNDQRKSRDEAYYKQKLINDVFEDVETVVFFNSPRWILRAGNYKTRSEADAAMELFMQQFPNFGKEMYVISDTVKIPL